MFHKEGSFHKKAHGKKLNDTPINKSQRKKLRESFLTSILPASTSVDQISSDLVNHIFLDPNSDVSTRKIKLPGATSKAGATCFFIRSPTTGVVGVHSKNENTTTATTQTSRTLVSWPYTKYPQVLLLQVGQILMPSLALLSVLPKSVLDELPTVMIPASVSKFLCRGADLMRSGMMSIPSKHDGWVVIRAVGNPQPFAVGFVTRGADGTSIGPEKKGVGVQIVTCYGDDIYRSQTGGLIESSLEKCGGSAATVVKSSMDNCGGEGARSELGGDIFDHGNYGNVGFVQGKQVYNLCSGGSSSGDASEVDDEQVDMEQRRIKDQEEEDEHGYERGEQGQNDEQNTTMEMDDKLKEVAVVNTKENETEETEQVEKNDDPETILLEAFQDAAIRISKSQLPMLTSTFYTQHMLPARREGSSIDLKSTRYKKLGPFLMEQAEKGIITLGASNGDAVAFLKSIDGSHLDLREARRRKKDEIQSTQTGGKKTTLVNLYIIPHSIVASMRLCEDDVKAINAKSEERRGTGYLTASECRDILKQYLQENELVDEFDPEMVRVDGPLCDSLFRKTKRQLQNDELGVNEYPENVTRKELNNRWLEKMDRAYAIVALPGSHIISMKRGDAPKISFSVEARQSKKKFITRVRGLEEVSAYLF